MRFIRCVRERTKKRTTENPCAARLLSIYLYFSTIVRYKYSPNMRVSFFLGVCVCVVYVYKGGCCGSRIAYEIA